MFLLAHAVVLAALAPVPAAETAITVTDRAGTPVSSLVVALLGGDARVRAWGTTDLAGRVQLPAGKEPLRVGVVSGEWVVSSFEVRETGPWLKLAQVHLDRAEVRAGEARGRVHVDDEVGLTAGMVVDEGGAPLAGVRIEAFRGGTSARTAVGWSDREGRFELLLPRGDHAVTAWSPGLGTARVSGSPGALRLVMSVKATTEAVTVRASGHVLRFDPNDSVDPPFVPPAPVRAWLRFRYDYSTCEIARIGARRKPEQAYWWMRVLESEPMNPAKADWNKHVSKEMCNL